MSKGGERSLECGEHFDGFRHDVFARSRVGDCDWRNLEMGKLQGVLSSYGQFGDLSFRRVFLCAFLPTSFGLLALFSDLAL